MRLSVTGVLVSEWLKFQSLRSSLWSGLLGVLGMPLVAIASASDAMPAQYGTVGESETVGLLALTSGAVWAVTAAGVGAAVFGASDYRAGSPDVWFCAVPRRGLMVTAKLAVAFVFGAGIALLGVLASACVTAPIVDLRGYQVLFLDPRIALPGAAAMFVVGATSAVACALGLIARSGVPAVVFVLVVMVAPSLLAPGLANLVVDAAPLNIAMLLPSTVVGSAIYAWPGFEVPSNVTGAYDAWVLPPWEGGVILSVWVVVATVAALVAAKLRDA